MTKMTVGFRAQLIAAIVVAGHGDTRDAFQATVGKLVSKLQAGYHGRFAAQIPSTFPIPSGTPEARWQGQVLGLVLGVAEEHGFTPERVQSALAEVLAQPAATFRAMRHSAEVAQGSALAVATVVAASEVLGATYKLFDAAGFLGHATVRADGLDYVPTRKCPEIEGALRQVAGR